MKILFTGASSFSGMWFVRELAKAGHRITACFRSPQASYSGLRFERIEQIKDLSKCVYNCSFGSEDFFKLIEEDDSWDLFCHHAADVTNYKSPDFNVAAALENNTHLIKAVLLCLQSKGCHKILLTGSVFEQREGAGSDHLRAVSPYGLSKGLTADVLEFYASTLGMKLGKFVIPNPFGPYEEVRFTTYLIQSWYARKKAPVSSPDYVRDNIHVSLLAKSYAKFASSLTDSPGLTKINPSGYPESQGAFTERFAKAMRPRLQLPCEFELKHQTEFPEPRVRINIDGPNTHALQWNEEKAWDELAHFYKITYGNGTK